MVTIQFQGRTGNRIIQYCAARLFAERNKLQLVTALPEEDCFLKPTPHAPGIYDATATEIVLSQNTDVLKLVAPGRYTFRGFFQSWYWLHAHREQIHGFFVKPVADETRNCALHRRFGDYSHTYGSTRIISKEWYQTILDAADISGEIDMYSDDLHRIWDIKVTDAAKKRHGWVCGWKDAKVEWNRIRNSNIILVGNSSYAWTAAFFSSASRIFTFKKWVSLPEIDMAEMPGWISVDGEYEK